MYLYKKSGYFTSFLEVSGILSNGLGLWME